MKDKIIKWLIGNFPWRQITILIAIPIGWYLGWIIVEWFKNK